MYCDLPVRLHACSPPRLAATQLARSSVLNRLIAPAGLSPALTPASRAHQATFLDRLIHVLRGFGRLSFALGFRRICWLAFAALRIARCPASQLMLTVLLCRITRAI